MEEIRLIQGRLCSSEPSDRLLRSIKFVLATISLIVYSFSLGYTAYNAGYEKGYETSEDNRLTLEEEMAKSKALLNKICYNWWFKTPPIQRKL